MWELPLPLLTAGAAAEVWKVGAPAAATTPNSGGRKGGSSALCLN